VDEEREERFGMPVHFMPGGNVFVYTWELDEWMEEYSGWVDVCIWMAVRREVQAERAEVPHEIEEAVAGVILAFWIDHPELGRP
jgi:hypothetical protein